MYDNIELVAKGALKVIYLVYDNIELVAKGALKVLHLVYDNGVVCYNNVSGWALLCIYIDTRRISRLSIL